MEREGAKPLEGRVARLILLVVVSVCVVFCVLCCLQNNPAFSSVTISHILKSENYLLCFSVGSYLHPSNYNRKKGTVIWPSQTTVPFFLVIICNLIKDSAKKYSDESAKTIRHCNRWPDDCTFFPGRNFLIKEPAKTIQAHGTPKHSNSQILSISRDWGSLGPTGFFSLFFFVSGIQFLNHGIYY
jgi:hypothetical protein